MPPAALGFAPHSGWAALVAVGGDPGEPTVLARERIEMADPKAPGARQPYHEVEGWPLPKAKARLDRLSSSARAMAEDALHTVVRSLERRGYRAATAGILESAGRKGMPLESILASHALIHSADGEHFRDALEAASAACGLAVRRLPRRELEAAATLALHRTAARLQASVQALGRPLGPPWGVDQKSAALLAWTLLVTPAGGAAASDPAQPRRR
jgi:hypothetical protein